jgi:hypothetical protein
MNEEIIDLMNQLAGCEGRLARMETALKMWMKFNSETSAENPCPDLALRARYRAEAVKLTKDLLEG